MKKTFLILISTLTLQLSSAQDIENILLAADDASLLLENYIRPAMNGLMYSMNGGWYSTAKTHKKLGFDLSITTNASFIPKAEEVFQFIASDYNYLTLPNGETELSTALSSNSSVTQVQVSIPSSDNSSKSAVFNMPGGIAGDLPAKALPTVMAQVGLGLPFGFEVKLRYLPETNYKGTSSSLFGAGLQHDILQYFGPLDKLPLSVSVLAAFTESEVNYQLNNTSKTDGVEFSNGLTQFQMRTMTVQALGSLDFPVLSFYAGVGYNKGNSSIKVKGDYILEYEDRSSNGNTTTYQETITDPIDMNFDVSGMRTTLGVRLNIAFFKAFADYTFQEYNTLSAGIAFSFR